jgi:hypothetical protein
LHIVGIVVFAAAVFILFPSPSWRSFLRWAATIGLFVGWLSYVALAITLLRNLGIAASWNQINWRASVLGAGCLLILASLTWLWTMARMRRVLTPLMKTLTGVALVVGVFFVALTILEPAPSTQPPSIAQTSSTPTPPTNIPPPPWEVVPAVPTVDNLAYFPIVREASAILDVYVDGSHMTFQQLYASQKDTLCEAGKAIRYSMKAYHNTLADLNHVERAIYDITAPAGRCH